MQNAISVALCAILFALSITPSSAQTKGASYSGTQIFEGTFFNEGPVSKLLPEIWNSASMTAYKAKLASPQVRRYVVALEQKISRKEPQFFDKFRAEMTSGDPGVVREAMTVTHNAIIAALPTPSNGSRRGIQPSKLPASDVTVQGEAVVDTVAIVVGAAVVAIVLVLALVAVVPESSNCQTSECTNAQQNRFVEDRGYALLAQRLQS